MKIIKYVLLCIIFILCKYNLLSQNSLEITLAQAEQQFFQRNLQLLAQRCNIAIADAAIVQAKVLNNPAIGIGDINFWYPNAGDELGISPASFGNRLIFSVELEQIIRTAGKRRKLVNLEKISKDIAIQEFEAFMLNLKTELRSVLHETIYLQSYSNIIHIQQDAINNLVEVYKKNLSNGNIAKNELIRLQSSLIELETEDNELLKELHGQYKQLKILLNIPPETEIKISPATSTTKKPDEISLPGLFEIAKTSHPEFLLAELNQKYSEKLLVYEKSQRSPDVALSLNYDRYGGVWKNFVGIGISLDLPVFNHNQGNIKMAKFQIEQSNYNAEHQKNVIFQEIVEAYEHYTLNYNYYKKLMDNDFSEDLENMLEAYSRNFTNKNINMLEYIDFMYAYKTTKQAILIAKKNLEVSFAELQNCLNHDL